MIYGPDGRPLAGSAPCQVTKISASFGRRQNVGDYSSLEFHVSLSGDVEPGADVEAAWADLYARCKAEVRRQLRESAQDSWPTQADWGPGSRKSGGDVVHGRQSGFPSRNEGPYGR